MDPVQDFVFADNFLEDQYMLFEMPDETLDKLLKGEAEAEFVSNQKDPIVLCVDDKTFDVLEFDTSNQLLPFMENTILTQNSSTFELRDVNAPFLKFRKMMKEYPMTLEELGGGEIAHPFVYDELADNALCSLNQFDEMLTNLCSIRINEFVLVPSNDLKDRVIDQIIRYSQTQDDWRRVNLNDLLSKVNFDTILIIPPTNPEAANENIKNLITSVLIYLSESFSNNSALLDDKKVVKHIIKNIIQNEREQFMHKEEFEQRVIDLIPHDIKFQDLYIHGVCAPTADGYKYVDEESLPIDVVGRFKALFAIQKTWKEHDLEPFFEYFCTESLSFNTLANRYARFADDLWMPR